MTSEYTTYGCPACGMQHRAGDGVHGEMCPDLRRVIVKMNAMEQPNLDKHWRSMWAQVSDDDFFVKPEESQVSAIARRVAREEYDRRHQPGNGWYDEVRAVAREEIAKAYGGALEAVKKCARDDALEDAARIAHSWNPSHYHKAAQEIRSLKSQPAAPTFRGVPIPPHPQREEIIKPAAQARAEKPWTMNNSAILGRCEDLEKEIASLRKERDELRHRCVTADTVADELRAGRAAADREYAALHAKLDQCSRASQVLDAKLAEADKALDEIEQAKRNHYVGHFTDEGFAFAVDVILKRHGRLTPRKQEDPR